MSNKVCCVPGCSFSAENKQNKEVLHKFPNPAKDKERFNTWVYSVGGNILGLNDDHIFKYRRVCRKHFEVKFLCRNNLLSNIAVPTKYMPELWQVEKYYGHKTSEDIDYLGSTIQLTLFCHCLSLQSSTFNERQVLTSIENVPEASTKEPKSAMPHLSSATPQTSIQSSEEVAESCRKSENRRTVSKVGRKVLSEIEKKLHQKLVRIGVKLSKCRSQSKKQAVKIKAMQKIISNPHLSKALDSWPSTARILMSMQFRERKIGVKGRRFTLEEKIMALTIFKQSPKGYRFFRKIYILPSPQTLTKLLGMADIKPGINKRIIKQIKKATQNMKIENRLCIVLFNEMALKAHLSYNEKKDRVTGFVTNGNFIHAEFADHAQVFMVRGLIKNYKEPISYTFSQSATKGPELAVQLKEVIKNLQESCLVVVATVCDQGTNNVHCIKLLMQETRATLLRKGEEHKGNYFLVNDHEVVLLYDPPCLRRL